MLSALIVGTAIGALVAAQVGPVWLLCARTSARYGVAAGSAIGIGVAAVDTVYAALGALGAGVVLAAGPLRVAMGFLGAAVLGYYAFRTLRSAYRIRRGLLLPEQPVSRAAGFRTGVVVTASNPLTILSWAAIFGGAAALPVISQAGEIAALLLGVALGSLAWHLVLSVAFGLMGGRMSPAVLSGIDVASGIGLAVFGCLMAYAAVMTALHGTAM